VEVEEAAAHLLYLGVQQHGGGALPQHTFNLQTCAHITEF
jgi:hypothetical protein